MIELNQQGRFKASPSRSLPNLHVASIERQSKLWQDIIVPTFKRIFDRNLHLASTQNDVASISLIQTQLQPNQQQNNYQLNQQFNQQHNIHLNQNTFHSSSFMIPSNQQSTLFSTPNNNQHQQQNDDSFILLSHLQSKL